MARLILLRHAKAEPERPGGGDFARALTARGREQARQAAAWLALQPEWPPARVLCSPSRRTLETAEPIRAGLAAAAFREEAAIYEASAETLLERIAAHLEEAEPLLLIGHNPALSEVLERLCAEDPRAREALPTGGIAVLAVERVAAAGARLLRRWSPP
ncbi:MAG: histidine phosphatase family protein [Xanthomonadales bacterium]|nr:histidine phosphatase family protein [Xanthomonadales bacterium]